MEAVSYRRYFMICALSDRAVTSAWDNVETLLIFDTPHDHYQLLDTR